MSNKDQLKILEAIKKQYNRHSYESLDNFIRKHCKDDQQASHYGPLTIEIASETGICVSYLRRKLNKLADKGVVIKFPMPSGGHRWWYVGLLDEIRGREKQDF